MFPSLDQAIGNFEGFGTPGTIATRQNNPGNLIYGPFAQSMGASGAGTNNIAIFPNTETGFNAMDSLIQQYANSGYNIQQLIGAWSPGNAPGNTPQSTQNYTNYVAQQAGVSPSTSVSALQNGNQTLSKAGSILGGIFGGIASGGNPGSAVQGSIAGGVTGIQAQNVLANWSFSRIAAIAIGLIAIGGAIYLFKPAAINGIIEKGTALAV